MSAFDETLDKTVKILSDPSIIAFNIETVTVIRDLWGKIRLAISVGSLGNIPDQSTRNRLEQALEQGLGAYWGKGLWFEEDRDDTAFQAAKDQIHAQRVAWNPSGYTGPIQWYKLERRYSKSSWLQSPLQPPWPLNDEDVQSETGIVSFYSFKGGVGRTTALATTAILLAKAGKSVMVLDLDVEAPGIGPFLAGNTLPADGLLDYLIESQIQPNRPNLDAYLVPVLLGQTPIRVMGAGKLDANYLEKLARLDFDGYAREIDPSTRANPLEKLLLHLRDEYHPDFILLDVRAGLHDIGGLSLNGLSHLDVIFARNDQQSRDGLNTLLELFGRRSPKREIFLVHAQIPESSSGPSYDKNLHDEFRNYAFDLFGHFYYQEESQPDIDDEEAPYGIPFPFQSVLQRISTPTDLEPYAQDPKYGFIQLAKLIGTYLAKETIP